MKTVSKTLPSAISDNKVEAVAGTLLNTLSKWGTLGILPSNDNNGGVLAEIPILNSNKTANDKVLQIVNTASSQYTTDDYMKLEESDYYKALDKEQQQELSGKNLYISKNPVPITKETATYQNFVNGVMTKEGEAILSGLKQTGQLNTPTDKPVELTVGYNATHGLLGDLLESAVDKSGIGTTGIAKQAGEFDRDVSTARAEKGSNFTNHSQMNVLTNSGIRWVQGNDNTGAKFMPQSYFIKDNGDKDGIPTFVSFGSPVSGETLKDLISADSNKGGLGYTYMGAFTNEHDYVGQGLGGNSGSINNGVNGQASNWQMFNLIDIGRLITPSSPHSGYNPYKFDELKNVTGYKK